MLPLNLHHTAIAVRDLGAMLDLLGELFGVEPSGREVVPDQGVEEAMVPLGGSFLQLLEPLDRDTPVGRFIDNHGEGLHHIAIQVADIDAALDHLREVGADLVDEVPRIGGEGHRIAFVHPSSTSGTLVELVEVE